MAAATAPASSPSRAPTLGAVVGLGLVLWGLAIGLETLNDNSFFTHLATGRFILDDWRVPTSDVFSYTAQGGSWVVQSWLPAAVYAAVERLGGAALLRVLFGLQTAALAWIVWRLTARTLALTPRLVAAAVPLTIGTVFWSERPLLVGLLSIGATLLIVDEGLDPRWLVPVGWIWVNSHGSFPLGLVIVGVLAAGTRLDGASPAAELRAMKWLAGGFLAAMVNPLGPRILVFPVELLARQDILSHVVEWRAPAFTSVTERFFLLQVLLGIVAVVRRPSYRAGGALAFAALVSLLAVRNVSAGSLLLVPVIAGGLDGLGTIAAAERPRLTRAATLLIGALLVVVVVARLDEPDVSLRQYPVRPLAWIDEHGIDLEQARLVAPDFVGNFLTTTHGPGQRVFVDDRFDMYPTDVVLDSIELVEGSDRWDEVLDRYDADLVVWQRDRPLGSILRADARWAVVYGDAKWIVACRRTSGGAVDCDG